MSVQVTESELRGESSGHTADRVGPDEWTVSWLKGQSLDTNQAIVAIALAEAVADPDVRPGLDHAVDPVWAVLDRWAGRLGLTRLDAAMRAEVRP